MARRISGLGGLFVASRDAFSHRPAVEVDGQVHSYADLHDRAASIAATLVRRRGDGPLLTAVLGQRSVSGFAGILGALLAGHGYVPVLPTFPAARTASMINRAGCDAVLVDHAGMGVLADVLQRIDRPVTVIVLDDDANAVTKERHTVIDSSDLQPVEAWQPVRVGPEDIAYLLFTSGSTGQPKGVGVTHANILRFLDVVVERYGLTHTDRFSHIFEVTFDLSLFDMFAAWRVGGCLCVPNAKQRLLPAGYVNEASLTVWFSVPSTALLMKKTKTLTERAFPGLRVSLFCGEALPVEVAEAWASAAPNSLIENVYGPTELTLACTAYRWGQRGAAEAEGGVVPIGDPFPKMKVRVVDENLAEVAPGEAGELTMTGPQLTPGYWNDPERTAQSFVELPGCGETYYRTGDRVRRAKPGAPMVYLGRLDHQIKLRGFRVELGEIEAVMRREGGLDAAIAIGWPETPGGADGVVAFIDDDSVDITALRTNMATELPSYMIPRKFVVVDEFPLNPNGKIDRKALRAMLR